jgi:hypothetical protein
MAGGSRPKRRQNHNNENYFNVIYLLNVVPMEMPVFTQNKDAP